MVRFGRAGTRFGRSARDHLLEALEVQDHDHPTVAEDRVAGIDAGGAQHRRQRLDHDLLGIEHLVDDEADAARADPGQDHVGGPGRVRRVAGQPQEAGQGQQREEAVAQPEHRRVADTLDRMLGPGSGPHQLNHVELADAEALAAGADDQHRDDGQRERDADREDGAPASLGGDLDHAAQPPDVAADDIHPHAAAGDAAHLFGRGKAGMEDQAALLLPAHGRELVLARQPARQRLGRDGLQIEAAAVVGEADHDVAALVPGGEADAAALGLAGEAPLGRAFQPVVGRVPHHVGEGIPDMLQDLPVELGVAAIEHELDVLAQIVGEIADETRQPRPGIADGLQPGPHHRLLQLGGDPVEALDGVGEIAIGCVPGRLQELVAGEDELAHEGHQGLQVIEADTESVSGSRLRGHVGSTARRHGGRARGLVSGRRLILHERQRGPVGGGEGAEAGDDGRVVPGRLRAVGGEAIEDDADPVHGSENGSHHLGRGRQSALAEQAQHALGGMGHAFQACQAQEAASALDGVDDAEDRIQALAVRRLPLEQHELGIERRHALTAFGQELREELIHRHRHAVSILAAFWRPFPNFPLSHRSSGRWS